MLNSEHYKDAARMQKYIPGPDTTLRATAGKPPNSPDDDFLHQYFKGSHFSKGSVKYRGKWGLGVGTFAARRERALGKSYGLCAGGADGAVLVGPPGVVMISRTRSLRRGAWWRGEAS